MADNPLSAIKLNNGAFRVFSAGGSTYRFEGIDSWGATGGTPTPVIWPIQNTIGSCGFWLNDLQKVPSTSTSYFGFAHAETACNYANGGQTHKSMTLFLSDDEGQSWRFSSQILSGTDLPTPGAQSGEGDCTAVADNSYIYLYCLRTRDFTLIAARAPKANPTPGNWYKYKDGAWSEPGLGGDASPLRYASGSIISFGSASVSSWNQKNYVVLVNNDSVADIRGGVNIAFSSNYVDFFKPAQPLLVTDGANWNRSPSVAELIAYPSAIGVQGGRSWDTGFLLTYTFLEPGEDFSRRFLVFREVNLTMGSVASNGQIPQVGVELSKWLAPGTPQGIRNTTAPVQGNYSTYAYAGSLGYILTAPLLGNGAPETVALEECVSYWPGNADFLVTHDGTCSNSGYRRLRTIGWIYSTQQPDTVPLYRCWSPSFYKSHFISNSPTCDGRGELEFLLGYAMNS